MEPVLKIAYAAASSMLPDMPIIAEEDGRGLSFSLVSSSREETLKGIVEHYKKDELLLVGMMPCVVLPRMKGLTRALRTVERQLEPMLADRYGEWGYVETYHAGGYVTTSYEVPVEYGCLEDEEIAIGVRTAISRSLRAAAMMKPVLEHLARGTLMGDVQTLGLLLGEHNRWEIIGFTNSKRDMASVFWPKGFFGKGGELRPQ